MTLLKKEKKVKQDKNARELDKERVQSLKKNTNRKKIHQQRQVKKTTILFILCRMSALLVTTLCFLKAT